MRNNVVRGIFVLSVVLLGACMSTPEYSEAEKAAEGKALNAFFERSFQGQLDRSPMWKSYLGIKEEYDQLDDLSDEFAIKEQKILEAELEELEKFDFDKLSEEDQLSYQIFKYFGERNSERFKYHFHNYPVNQQFGLQSEMPSFMSNNHPIDSYQDAKDYISRLQKFRKLFAQQIEGLKKRQEKGVIPPRFVFPKVISDSRNVIAGQPFSKGEDSVLWADFKRKVGKLKISRAKKNTLLEEAARALLQSVGPAYRELIVFLEKQASKAPEEGAAKDLPDGEDFYQSILRYHTSTDDSPEEVHRIGLQEVARIHGEMKKIMLEVGFKGDLQEFFKYINTDKKFRLPSTKWGRQQYLKKAEKIVAQMEKSLDQLFGIRPKAAMEVRAVEAYREKSAGLAFYQGPAVDGSRPGIFYVNLSNMASANTYELEALAYHEGIPGHHMQVAIAQELEGIPRFRKHGWMTAYGEGWGLYAELIPYEIGMYQDPYSNFGRLSMELWRACRLVVDTGLHAKGWPMQKAIDYLLANTPTDQESAEKSIQRYVVMPGQATAYKVGMLKILELRKKAKELLGEKFDIRHFHDQVLKNGPLPLNILEKQIAAWVENSKTTRLKQ